ncbi:MAG: polysaccharide deacetylase [bacterium]|nr:MAG: polysaccharide deacetylase [bacterium]
MPFHCLSSAALKELPMRKGLMTSVLLAFLLLALPSAQGARQQVTVNSGRDEVPILLYHRFGPAVADGMTLTTKVFASHLEYLAKNGYTIIPLRKLIDFYLRKVPDLPPKSVVIVVDDGHKSVYTDMLPLVRKYLGQS